MNHEIENLLKEAGEKIDIGKDEIKYTLKHRKKAIIMSILFTIAFLTLSSIQYGPLRYCPSSIKDFFQIGGFF